MTWSGLPASDPAVMQDRAFHGQFVAALAERFEATGGTANFVARSYPRTIDLTSPPSGSSGQKAFAGSQNSQTTHAAMGLIGRPYRHNGSAWVPAGSLAYQGTDTLSLTNQAALLPGDYAPMRGSTWGLPTWRSIQSTVASFAGSYWNDQDYPDGPAGIAIAGVIQNSIYTYFGTQYTAAGLNPSGFIRKYPRTINPASPPAGTAGMRAYAGSQNSQVTGKSNGLIAVVYEHDGAAWVIAEDQLADVDVLTSYGLIEPGDYVGVWIPNEIYQLLGIYKWSFRSGADIEFVGGTSAYGESNRGDVEPYPADLAEARTQAEADYDVTDYDDDEANGFPAVVARESNSDGDEAELTNYAPKPKIKTLGSSVPCTIDLYLRTVNPGGAFPDAPEYDASKLGLDAGDENVLALVQTLALGTPTAGARLGDVLGDADAPDWPTEPEDGTATRGYVLPSGASYVNYRIAIIKHQFTYG